MLEKPLIQHRLVVPDPECLAQGISDGGGGCGCGHLVPVSSLLADRRRLPQEGEVPAAGADVHPGDESAVLGTAANEPSAKFSPTRAFSSGLKRLLPLSDTIHY